MENFKRVLEKGNLLDLKWVGSKFTWSNRHKDASFMKEGLDKAVANPTWVQLFKECWVEVLTGKSSDHRPILLTMNRRDRFIRKDCRIFRYEASWDKEEGCEKVIQKAWRTNDRMRDSQTPITEQLERCIGALLGWSKHFKLDSNKEIKLKFEVLKGLQDEESCLNAAEIKKLQKEVGTLLENEDIKWKQRAKRNWYALGDRNTKYFHACANQRRQKNIIKQIEDEQGRICKDQEGIEGAFKGYFENLFSSTQPRSEEMEDCLKHLKSRVTREANEKLLRLFSKGRLKKQLKVGKKGKKGNMAIKLDMSKSYDRIEWPFVKAVMKKLGFCDAWIEQVMSCIISISYSVLVNGKTDLIGNTKGVTVVRGGSRVNHLLFADDCILFGRACVEEWKRLQELLLRYERASGQFLNKEKTIVYFNSNTPVAERDLVLSVGESMAQGSFKKYLGLQTMVGKSKYNTFRCLKERVWQKINNWKNCFLSGARKEVLIKAVLQAIPSYTMSVFKLPKKLCKEINIMLSKFWWSNHQKSYGIHWRSWEKMGTAKGKGGLGFRDLASFNLALLAKQAWRLLQSPHSLIAKIFKEKYFKNTSITEAKLGNAPSLIWRSVWSSLGLLKEGLRWKVGDGAQINIWGQK
ncbi:hypothetical protein F2P56_008937 [Juglans regia]|uniref:Uncharacterized protein LOC108986421 n=2 Tax=Juglans regia TaxID=51240 RepID=A0A2I4E5A0_JUGRE|nr:uncharacterized protein LOC108986421 [Juglans regia]KAF5472200.1 hypothetical protein F2P56_008937 [Juglans regia]